MPAKSKQGTSAVNHFRQVLTKYASPPPIAAQIIASTGNDVDSGENNNTGNAHSIPGIENNANEKR